MKIIEINCVTYGSTGKIAMRLAELAEKNHSQTYVAVPLGRHNHFADKPHMLYIGNRFSEDSHILLSLLTGKEGEFSRTATRRFVKEIQRLQPDLIHLHNLHRCYINLPILFDYLRAADIPVVWTLHDCWAFTGHCAYYDMVECTKWQTGCHDCPQYREYPKSYIDNSERLYNKKKKWFGSLNRLTLVTPSYWLAGEVKKSFLKDYPVVVIKNGVDLQTFRPIESAFRQQYHLEDKHIVLGVASGWMRSKGMYTLIELSKQLSTDYQIVMVGQMPELDAMDLKSIICIPKTQNADELARIYSSADVFANPTLQEAFGLVNIEALACGTPVVTYRTGGSTECIDSSCGIVVEKNDLDSFKKAIQRVCEEKPFTKEACVSRAKLFEINRQFQKYYDLYEELTDDKSTGNRIQTAETVCGDM